MLYVYIKLYANALNAFCICTDCCKSLHYLFAVACCVLCVAKQILYKKRNETRMHRETYTDRKQ